MLAPIAWRVPPRHYGPWERVVSLLTEGLIASGINVTLFATADSETSAQLSAVVARPYEEDKTVDVKVWESLHLAHLFERAGEFDLIHNHYDFLPLTYSHLIDTPMVTTIHGFSSDRILPVYQKFNGATHYVAISQANPHPLLTYAATIHHGIDLGEFTFRQKSDGYLLFFGRIHPDKGTAEAVRVALRTGRSLVIAGIIQDHDYFETNVAPYLGGQIRYVGSVRPNERNALLGGADALLHLINFDEPFGLSMIEAMACGTPVIATRRGSVPEIVEDRTNGFIVQTEAQACEAVASIPELSRSAVCNRIKTKFSCERMVSDYIRVYKAILNY